MGNRKAMSKANSEESTKDVEQAEQGASEIVLAAIDRTSKDLGVVQRRALIFVGVIAVLSVMFAGYQVTRPPLPPQVYAAERDTGRVTELAPYAVIPANPGTIYNVYQRFATILFSMNAFNYREQFENNIRPVFKDDAAYMDYVQSVRNSSWFDVMINDEMQMRASIAGAPVIIDQGVFGGGAGQYWTVNAPIYIRLEAAGLQPINERRILTLRITHSSDRSHNDGMAVDVVRISRG